MGRTARLAACCRALSACFWCARCGVGTFRAGEYGECALLAFCSTGVLSRVWFGARGCGEDGMGEVIRWVER